MIEHLLITCAIIGAAGAAIVIIGAIETLAIKAWKRWVR